MPEWTILRRQTGLSFAIVSGCARVGLGLRTAVTEITRGLVSHPGAASAKPVQTLSRLSCGRRIGFPFFCRFRANRQRAAAHYGGRQRIAAHHARGYTHPYARPQFDRGAAPDSLPMARMLLVLQRSAAQEAALDALYGNSSRTNPRRIIIRGLRCSNSGCSLVPRTRISRLSVLRLQLARVYGEPGVERAHGD